MEIQVEDSKLGLKQRGDLVSEQRCGFGCKAQLIDQVGQASEEQAVLPSRRGLTLLVLCRVLYMPLISKKHGP